MQLKIDPEFKSITRTLTQKEFSQLEENIVSSGAIRDPIVIWDGIIVDGHNRYLIFQRHPDISFKVQEVAFTNRYEAIIWICKNQLGKRNLTPTEVTYLLGKQYASEKASHGGNRQRRQDTSSGQNVHLKCEKTAVRIARENGVNEKTVRRAEYFAKGMDLADELQPGFREGVLSGTIKEIRKKDLELLPLLEPHKQVEKLADMLSATEKPRRSQNPQQSHTMGNTSVSADPEVKELEYMLIEMQDALNTLTSRWDTCISEHTRILMLPSAKMEIHRLVTQLSSYITKIQEVFNESLL